MSNNDEMHEVKMTDDITNAPWWVKDVAAALRPQTRQMLEEYAGIPQDQQIEHIEGIVRPPTQTTTRALLATISHSSE